MTKFCPACGFDLSDPVSEPILPDGIEGCVQVVDGKAVIRLGGAGKGFPPPDMIKHTPKIDEPEKAPEPSVAHASRGVGKS